MGHVGVIATGYYVPDEVLDNAYFVERNPYFKFLREENGEVVYDDREIILTEDKIVRNTGGMRERRRVSDGEGHVDLIERAFAKTGFDAKDLDGIIIGTVSDDRQYPNIASETQERIGARPKIVYAGDVKAACSSFSHALDHAVLRIEKYGGYYLVAGVELMTRMVDMRDVNCTLFGDGCGVMVLGPSESQGIIGTRFCNDVSGSEYARRGSPPSINWIYRDSNGFVRMPNGPEVKAGAWRIMSDLTHKVIDDSPFEKNNVDLYIPHQANGRILDEMEVKNSEMKGRIYRSVERYGNMSGATLPVAFAEALEVGRIRKGDLVVMVDVGAGLSAGSVMIRLGEEYKEY